MEAAQVVVFGAGAFGGWTALELAAPRRPRHACRRMGARQRARELRRRDARHPRDLRRRATIYTKMAARALRVVARARGTRLAAAALSGDRRALDVRRDDPFARASLAVASKRRASSRSSVLAKRPRRYPQIAFDGDHVSALRAGGRLSVRAPRVRDTSSKASSPRAASTAGRRGRAGDRVDGAGARDPLDDGAGSRRTRSSSPAVRGSVALPDVVG